MTAAELLLYLANQADIVAMGRFTSSNLKRTIIIISCAIELRPQTHTQQQREEQSDKSYDMSEISLCVCSKKYIEK